MTGGLKPGSSESLTLMLSEPGCWAPVSPLPVFQLFNICICIYIFSIYTKYKQKISSRKARHVSKVDLKSLKHFLNGTFFIRFKS